MALISQKKPVAQHPSGPMEANLGRGLGDTELGGDLVVRHFVHIAQHDHLA
jgi:hypothetical protein